MTKEQCDIFNSRLVGTMNILHGGAALAMAETLAGAGSLAIVGEYARICGLQVSGNHIGMSAKEGKVIGKATPIHIGRTTHIWNVEIRGEDGKLLSTERVTNMVLA